MIKITSFTCTTRADAEAKAHSLTFYPRPPAFPAPAWTSIRNSAHQVRFKAGWLGISLEALRVMASEVNLQSLPKSSQNNAGLPKELVLYCARHDYGTRVLMRTGNLAAVMKTMGHRDVETAMYYQHPELEIVRAALDFRAPASEASA